MLTFNKKNLSGPRQEATSVTFETPEGENVRWQKLEELVLVRAGGVPSAFKPSLQCFTNRTANSANPVAVMGGKNRLVTLLGPHSALQD